MVFLLGEEGPNVMGGQFDEGFLKKRSWAFRELSGEFGFNFGEFFFVREVVPFFGIIVVVVEFFAVVEVADVAPAFGAEGELGDVVAGEGGMVPVCGRVLE